MASKHTTRPLQRISLVRSNREGWIGNDGAHLTGVQARSTDQAGGAATIEAYHPCTAGKLLQTKKT